MLFGRYIAGDSIIHQLDPRIKILALFAVSLLVFFVPGLTGLILIALWLMTIGITGGISPFFFLRMLGKIWFFFALIAFFQLIHGSGLVLVELPFHLRITSGSLNQTLFLSMRLILLVYASLLLSATTTPLRFVGGVDGILTCLRLSKSWVHDLSMAMGIAMRFVPTMQMEWTHVIKAQKSRGVPLDHGGWIGRIRNLFSVWIPLMGHTIRTAEGLEKAMRARCYGGWEGRSKFDPLRIRRTDILFSVVHGSIMVFALIPIFP